jgi:hypothetical protein
LVAIAAPALPACRNLNSTPCIYGSTATPPFYSTTTQQATQKGTKVQRSHTERASAGTLTSRC